MAEPRLTLLLWKNGIGDPFAHFGDATSTEMVAAAQVLKRAGDDLYVSLQLGGEPLEGHRQSGSIEGLEGEEIRLTADDVLVTLEWPGDSPISGPDVETLHCTAPSPAHLWAASALMEEAGRNGWRMKMAEQLAQKARVREMLSGRKPLRSVETRH